MPGVNWEYKDDPKSRKFWSISSDNYLYLGQLFIDFDFEFDQPLGERTARFVLITEHKDFLINGVEQTLQHLLKDFEPDVPFGESWVENEFQGTKLKLYIRTSRQHQLINRLIRFYDFLKKSKTEEIELMFYGGEAE